MIVVDGDRGARGKMKERVMLGVWTLVIGGVAERERERERDLLSDWAKQL